jgi:3-methyladenine DNA glycosylase/8-oxoguanine DNA glycosylase
MLKRGIMTSVLKKNKDCQNPANYGGITVTKIFTKIIQSILKSRVDIQIDQIQNPLERGFTEAIPMLFAAFIASEVIIESSTNNYELLLLTLDAEKAFDKLNHEILFNKLYHNGIKGDMWVFICTCRCSNAYCS